jgi:undecaprenyl-diphosphatase
MDLSTLLGAVFLGVVEGLTEFIPVSSTGHLILLVDLIGFRAPPGKTFEIVIQLGAVAAVCWAYREKFLGAAVGAFTSPDDRRFVLSILVALVPAIVVGFILYPLLRSLLVPLVVAVALIVGGVAILVIERIRPEPRHDSADRLPLGVALAVGVCQTVAMIPGVSRSGATIMGGLMLGVERKAATEFSFFLAVPTLIAAGDEGQRHRHGVEEIRLDVFREQQAEHRGGNECDYEIAVELDIHLEEPRPVFPHHRQHGPGLDHYVEDVPALVARVKQLARENEMSGARNGQELGETFDDAEYERLEIDRVVHARAILRDLGYA